MRRAVFLDRDGVLNRAIIGAGKPYPPSSPEQVEIEPDVPAALARLKAAGFFLLVITNQPDVARGAQDRQTVEAIHARLREALPIDEFFVCFHDDADNCTCRKPKPGLLLEAAVRYGLDLSAAFVVGDRWRDIDAGHAAGCRTVWIDRGYDECGPAFPAEVCVHSLGEAADWIISVITLAR